MARRPRLLWIAAGVAGGFALVLAFAAWWWRDQIVSTLLDPGVPFQIYQPPAAPDYRRADAWAMQPAHPETWSATAPPADIFFVPPTTYDGGKEWNAPIGDAASARLLARVMLPNYAGPFQTVGRVFAPRYRQAGLYSFTTLRDDAREARRFAYRDVRAAFDVFTAGLNRGRPIILVGVEQGGQMAARLALESARDPTARRRLAAVYLIDTVAPAEAYAPGSALPACRRREQAGCVVGWAQAPSQGGERAAQTLLDRALVWNERGQLEHLDKRPALCVNPLTGTEHGASSERANLGAANATGLEWGARPAFLPREVSAVCRGGLLWVSPPRSPSLKRGGFGIARLRAPGFNLFYADLEADARARVKALMGANAFAPPAPPIQTTISVRPSPIHRID